MHQEPGQDGPASPRREASRSPHPALRVPDLAAPDCPCFEPYQTVPKAIPVSCSGDAVSKIAPHLSGGAGPSGVDAVALRYWLTRFERASGELRSEMALWQDWLANLSPPWAAYRALMARRLVALDKKPGVRPVGIGEIFQRLLAKLVIADAGDQAKLACGSKQLCAGLEAGIEGTLHAVRRWVSYPTENIEDPLTPLTNSNNPENPDDLSDTRSDDDSLFSADPQDPPAMRPGEGLTLVDATNGFNELSRMTMLWTVRHLWPKGSRFAFNSYRHAALLVVRNRTRDAEFLASCEGVTQGDPLSMILYGIALIPLVELLRHDCPEVMQPWYADDLALLGRHAANARCLKLLTTAGPFFGYFPNPGKSWYVCDAVDEDEARAAFDAAGLDIQFSRGQRYVGGFIGTEDTRQEWLKPMIQQWVDGVKTLAAVASRFPQTAYAGMASSLQAEWQYVCRVVPGIAAELAPVETAIRSNFLPSLFGGSTPMAIDDDFRRLLGHSVKMGGIGIRDPTKVADRLFAASMEATASLAENLAANAVFSIEAHRAQVRQASATMRRDRATAEEAFLAELSARDRGIRNHIDAAKESGAWLTALPRRLNGTQLSPQEFQDALRLRYGKRPLNLEDTCDGCCQPFSVEHAMSCKKGGLVTRRHEAVKQEWIAMAELAYGKSRVGNEPKIFFGRDTGLNAGETAANITTPRTHNQPGLDARGDAFVDGFWVSGTTCIFDVRITDVHAASYKRHPPARTLKTAEESKKKRYLRACKAQRRDFTPLVYSAEGMPGRETRAAEKRLASALSAKLERPYSEMVTWVRQRMCIANVRQATLLLRGSRVPRQYGGRAQARDGAAMLDLRSNSEW